MSLFGNTTATQNQNQNQNQNQSTGTSLFGNSTTNQQNPGGSLFGSNSTTTQPNQGGGGLFRRDSIVALPTVNTGTSLFGGSNTATQTQPNQAQSTGLFGAGTNAQNQNTGTQNQTQGTGLFGASTAQNQTQGTGLFGASTTQNQTQGTGLFGAPATTQPQNTGLFGAPATGSAQNTGLFGAPATTQNQTQGSSLFGSSTTTQQQQQAPSFFQSSAFNRTQPQQTHLSTLLQTGLGAHSSLGALGTTSQQDVARARLTEANISTHPNTPPIFSQIQTLIRKWDPNSTSTLLQTYLYNAVNAAYAPFYHRNPDEDEEAWEKALAAKPEPITDGEAGNVSFVPVLVRGFHSLGLRVEYQARTVNEMRARLHEMQNSLDAVMARHRLELSVRLENARRQHAALAQRCLRLAVKAQVLRQRNYPLDAAEEGLRKALTALEKKVMDPAFRAREEEVWARLVLLRERARWLEEEGKRVGLLQEGVERASGAEGGGVPEEVLVKTRKILKDYDGQISLLAKELEDVKKEFEEFEGTTKKK